MFGYICISGVSRLAGVIRPNNRRQSAAVQHREDHIMPPLTDDACWITVTSYKNTCIYFMYTMGKRFIYLTRVSFGLVFLFCDKCGSVMHKGPLTLPYSPKCTHVQFYSPPVSRVRLGDYRQCNSSCVAATPATAVSTVTCVFYYIKLPQGA